MHLDRFDLYAVGVLSGVLENSSKVYNPLQHYLRSPVEVMNPSNCAPYKVYVVVVSTTVALQWTPESLEAQELLSTEARSITGDEVTYHVLTDCQISFSSKGLGELYSHSQLFVHDDILIRRVSTLQGREISTVELLRITNSASASGAEAHTAYSVQADEEDEEALGAYPTAHLKLTGFSARRHCLFSTKRLPNELFCAETDSIRSAKRAVGVMGQFTNTVVSNVLISVDFLHLDALCRLMACKSDGLQRGEQYALRHIVLPVIPTFGELALQNDHLMTQSVPTKISAVHIKKFKIVMYYNLEPVLSSTARSVDVHQIAFGPALSQLAVVAHSWYLFELTAKYAVHTCIVGDIDAVTPNRFDLHITSRVGECPLVELQVDQLRLFYLQRSIMVLISFLRDHFISSLYATPQPSLRSVESSNGDAVSDASATSDVVACWGPPLPACRGLTRLCAVFQRSEVHLPLSSCSTDALVVLIDHTHVYRVYADMTPALTAYCKGPLILCKLWVSELRNSRKLMYLLFLERDTDAAVVAGSSSAAELPSPAGSSVPASTSALSQLFQPLASPAASENPVSAPASAVSTAPASAVAATIKWALVVHAMDLLVPTMDIEVKDVPEFCLAFAIINSLICSWCDNNAVGEETNLSGVYILKPIAPGPNDQPRSTIIVDVTAENLEWTLAQGQYLALINLIQHNFCELQELVPDIFALGPPHSVKLGEKVYGKYALDESLPICDTVPIHIKKGKIIAVESVPEYFELFCVPLPPAHFPFGINGHAIPLSTSADVLREVAFVDTIPAYSKHVQHRDKFFAQLASHAPQRGDKGVNLPKNKSKGRVPSNTEEQREETGESIIGVLFKDLEIDFYRRHDNGGNGIEVSAGTFVIVGIEDGNPEDEDIIVKPPVDIDDLSLDSIIFAPRCFPLLNSGSNRSAFQASGTPNPAPSDGQKASAEDAEGNLKFHNSDESPSPVPVPHIKYSQQGTGNLRRCIVSISDSMAVANIAKVLHTVEYFLKPIHVNTHRSLFVIAQSHLGPYDYKIALDMEVHVSNTVVCLTNISRRDGANALCFQLNLDYQQAWRGFLSSGPGLIGLNIDISVMNIYIAPMREINSSRIQSLVDPCVLVIGQEDRINPSTASLETNLALLAPHVKLGKWVHKVNHFETPTNTRIVRFAVAPANRPTTISPSSSSKSKKKKKLTRTYMSRSKSEAEGDQSEVPEEVLRSVPEDSSSEDGEEDGEESSDDDNDGDVDADDLDDAPQLGDAYYSGAETMNAPAVRVQISLKDIWFIATAVKQARTALNKRLIITTNQEDFFAKSKLTVQDIHHIPRLTYYLVHTPLQVPGRKNRHNELLAEICDFEAILRNNTYNLNILRLNIFDNCMLYTRSPQILHMASGSAAAVWAYNEATDLWEPLVEPFNMRAIGATDESIQAAGMVSGMLGDDEEKKRKGAKIRIEVVTDPLEMNAPQTALGHLIRKLSLADVVTTSSIHLPPYKVINELGVDVKFAIGMGDGIITEKEIAPGSALPVEVHQLAEALDAFKLRRNYTSGGNAVNESTVNKEYVMGLTFPNFRDIYQSRMPLPIDKVGVHTYDMYATGQKIADPSGDDVSFDKRRISMGGLGSDKAHLKATLAAIAAAAAMARTREKPTAAEPELPDIGEGSFSENSIHSDGNSITAGTPAADAEDNDRTTFTVQRENSLSPVTEETTPVLERGESTDGSFIPPPPVATTPLSTAKGTQSYTGSPRTPPPVPLTTPSGAPSPARPTLARRLSLAGPSTVGSDVVKFSQEVPLVIMEMRIKADGVREILLRSILSFKNNTTRTFQMSVRLYGSSVETTLAPGKEWYVPVRYVNPKSSLFVRLDERANWFEALPSMQSLIVQGKWGDPSRLRAQLCTCPPETPDITVGGHGWILLIKPEVKDVRAQMQGGSHAKLYVPVRYPNKEAYTKAMKEVTDVNFSAPAGGAGIAGGPTLKMSRSERVQPMCVQLLAPLQLCNLVPQPFLYRLADAEGLITSEGILLPGELVDIHSVYKIFTSRIFISVRMLNYCWSKWTLVFSRTTPFSSTERSTELTLTSMNFIHQNKELTLPSVDVFMTMKEYLIRFSCPVLISNRTGLSLDLCESSATDSYIPHSSRTAAEAFLPVLAYHRHKKGSPRQPASGAPETPNKPFGRPSFRNHRPQIASGVYDPNRSASRVGGGRELNLFDENDLRLGDFDAELVEDRDSDISESSCEECDSADGEQELMRRSSESFTLGNPLYLGSEDDMDALRDGDVREMPSITISASPAQQPGQKLRPLSTDRSYSPFSPTSPSPADGPTTFTTPGYDNFGAALTPKVSRTVVVTIHLPFDHLRQVDVTASADWTLMDVFLRVKQRLATALTHQTSRNYVFFPWDNGKLGPRKVDNSLIKAAQEEYENEIDPMTSSTKSRVDSVVSASAPAVVPAGVTQNAKESRPISMMFSRDRSVGNLNAPRKLP